MQEIQQQSGRKQAPYRGRIAPTPSGWLHFGHGSTFRIAWQRARERGGTLVYRTEDLDPDRIRPEYVAGAMEDLRWWGLDWDEGPDTGGPFAPYVQSARIDCFRQCLERLIAARAVYPSPHSRKQIAARAAERSPVDGDRLFPVELRRETDALEPGRDPLTVNWRFRVPDGREIRFSDKRMGNQRYRAGRDFGDFLVWRKSGVPAYELAVVADDHAMEITEVVRGADLLLSTARQLLIYEAMGWKAPEWYHCELVNDPATGRRMSKTHRSLALRALKEAGYAPGQELEAYREAFRR